MGNPGSPPTSYLPPLSRLHQHSAVKISSSLTNLQTLYWPTTIYLPNIISSRKTTKKSVSVPDSGYASAEEEEDTDSDPFEELRADEIERQFAIKWLTGFIAQSDTWIEQFDNEAEVDKRSAIVDEATHILSAFMNGGGNDATTEYAVTRKFDFTSSEGTSVQVVLNDAPLSSDDHTSVGLQSWGSSILLAQRICAAPADFLPTFTDRPLRILELGAGTGLLSIIAAKLVNAQPSSTIVATDYHPQVIANLSENVRANPLSATSLPLRVCYLDWEKPSFCPPLDNPFDIILAADVIYHPDHALWLRNCAERLLVRPSPDRPHVGVFWLMIPIRSIGRHEGVYQTVERIFPHVTEVVSYENAALRLGVLGSEEIGRQNNVGRADEDGYRLFKIRWGI